MFKDLTLLYSVFFLTSLPQIGQAKTFKNSYIQFSLPDRWECHLQNKAYICRHKVDASCLKNKNQAECKKQIKKSKEAIIILAAKEKSQIDTLPAYKQNLTEPRAIKRTKGPSTQSKVIHAKMVKIKGQQWVDGMHLSSELPYYYTRYLASIKKDVAVLITFSSHKLFYTKYSSAFFKSIKSLDITANDISRVSKHEVGNKVFSRPLDLPDDLINETQTSSSGNSSANLLFMLAFILAAVGIYIWVKSNQKK